MKRIGILIASFLVLGAAILAPAVNAASNAIGVNPRRDYVVAPGEKVSETLFVNNLSGEDELTVKIEVVDFKPQDQTGTPALQLKAETQERWSLKPYLSIPEQYTIPAGKSVEVPFTISIPSNLGAGSYYSAIRYSAVNPETGENVSLTSSAVTLMFVRVPGETRSSLTLEQFGAFTMQENSTDGAFTTFFSATQPKYISYLLKNNGNVAEEPKGSLLIKDIFGNEVKTFENANPKGNLVLIGQTRRIDVCLNEVKKEVKNEETGANVEDVECANPNLKPGIYKAQLGLVYGDNGNSSQELREVATFWYLPAWFIIAVVAFLGLVAFLVWKLVNKLKNRGKPTYGTRRR